MYERILVALDGSETAERVLPIVRQFAAATRTRVDLLRAIAADTYEGWDPEYGFFETDEGDVISVRPEADEYLERIQGTLKDLGVAINRIVEQGSPADVIVSEAETTPNTLIAMSTHGRSGFSRWMLGSVANKVLRASPTAVLVVRARDGEEVLAPTGALETMIVPLDGSALAEHILPTVADLARTLDLGVMLIQAVPTHGLATEYETHSQRSFQQKTKATEAVAARYLRDVRDRLAADQVTRVEVETVPGDAGGAIIDAALARPNSIVVISTHGRSGIGRWMLGSVADRVIRYSGRPVLVLPAARPEAEERNEPPR